MCGLGALLTHLTLALEVGELVHEQRLVVELVRLDELQEVEQLVHLGDDETTHHNDTTKTTRQDSRERKKKKREKQKGEKTPPITSAKSGEKKRKKSPLVKHHTNTA